MRHPLFSILLGPCALLASLAVFPPAGARAESDDWNAHLELGIGRPLVGQLGAPGDDGRDRLVPAGWLSLDWQFQRPWAIEAILGVGHQIEQTEVPGRTGAEFWQFSLGVRRRFVDDDQGYADERSGNWLGNLWVSGHMGYTYLDNVQFGFDFAAGYELSVVSPVQIGVFIRTSLLFGGRLPGADLAFFGGLSASIPLSADVGPADLDGDGLTDEREATLGTNPRLRDTDNDGLDDGVEVRGGTNARERDTDLDGIDDGFEDRNHDGDLDPGETDPRVADTDRGGIPDGDEVRDPRMDPRDPRDDDSDQDGIAEPSDRCPNTPEGTRVDSRGCAEIAETIELEGVRFRVGRADILPDSMPVLERALRMLEQSRDVRVEVAGHTDATGREATNRRLSRQRAESVRRWLIQNGIDPGRLTVRGYGSSEPVADNETEEGRARNRRIEFRRLDR